MFRSRECQTVLINVTPTCNLGRQQEGGGGQARCMVQKEKGECEFDFDPHSNKFCFSVQELELRLL